MTRERSRRSLRSMASAMAAVTLLATVPAWAGSSDDATSGMMPMHHQDSVMAGNEGSSPAPTEHMAMMNTWQQQDAKLDDLVAKMNGATGAAKVDAMAAVLTELVAQREAQHEMLSRRHPAAGERGGTQPADTGMSPGASCPMAGSHGAATVAGAGASPSTEAAARNANGAAG